MDSRGAIKAGMIEQFISFVIRPPRADYIPDQYLWKSEFTLEGRKYKRQDLELINGRGHTLQCSHYVPAAFPETTALPCVIYCHGNSGCRVDANKAVAILLPSNITVFTLDFSGSGLSGGDYVSLGWHEKDDLKVVVSHLRSSKQISCIGLWGRSMGAVTSLLYGAEDPSIAGIVLDSSFSSLYDLMMEVVDVTKIRLPKFTVKMAIQYMRRIIQKRATFDILDLNVLKIAPKSFIPALFGHAAGDLLIQPRHSRLIYEAYAGCRNIINFPGDHNSPRPQFFYDSISIFFYNVLYPPQISSLKTSTAEKYYNLKEMKVDPGMDEKLLYEFISGIRGVDAGRPSSLSAPPNIPNGQSMKSVVELLSESVSFLSLEKDLAKSSDGNRECFSGSSSNRESWGMCSSLGIGEDSLSEGCPEISSTKHQAFKSLATCLRRMHRRRSAPSAKEKTKKRPSAAHKPKLDLLRKRERLSLRLRECILKHVKLKRNRST